MAAARQILSIQYLRALAALGVVVFHNMERSGLHFQVGEAGVDIFFIISGFVMWTLADAQQPSPQSFLWRRLIRIAPLYWALTLLAALGATLFSGLFWKFDPSFDNIWKSLLFIPHESRNGGWSPLVVQGWTLNYEMFFYALFSLALLAPAKSRIVYLSGALFGLTALGFVYPSNEPVWNTYTNPLLLEFLAGIALAAGWRRGLAAGPTLSAALIALGLCILAAEQISGISDLDARVLNWGAPGLLIVAGALGLERAGKMPLLKTPLLLGDASYSIYLLHSFVTMAVIGVLKVHSPWLTLAIATPLSALAGVISYKLFEKPVMDWAKRLGRKPRPAPVIAQQPLN